MRPVVVKVGGASVAGGALEDLPGMLSGGTRIVLVHGGGKQLSRMLDTLGIPTRFHEGLRITDERTLEVAEMVFAGSVNKELVRGLLALGVPAAGISGTDGPVLRVEPLPGLGRVGRIVGVEDRLLEALWNGGFVPVVAPLGLGPEGAYNVNADDAAAALAVALGARGLLLLTDVDGLLRDGEPVPALTPGECERYVRSGIASGGMAPKLRAAAQAAHGGVPARIINGGRRGALAGALAGEQVGTLIQEGAFT
ncbi:acetylglutamate kinase [Rubrobacter xylanophilus]|uniref:Acetylglutamate kinase n=1 Tax=Rubrobacter xylanophilus TaxID=49319 RepID=A0A510HJJ3_9ACTN|nr:acetylglutamate kinase [Rubrobacter xylanophilus]BBL80179.1 acetylglutamate kinase [Rubrobacter xylanophilus]